MPRSMPRCFAVATIAAGLASASAGGHRDISLIPLGSFALSSGTNEISLKRPFDRFGVIESPIVLMAMFDPSGVENPIQVRCRSQRHAYPIWRISRPGQMYVLPVSVLERDAGGDKRTLSLKLEVSGAPAGFALMAGGSPDFVLAGPDALGPLEDILKSMSPGPEQTYLSAIAQSTGSGLARAKAALETLDGHAALPAATDRDRIAARFARAALRRIRFAEAEATMKPSFANHYRMGLYAQQCGMFREARLHFGRAQAARGKFLSDGGSRRDVSDALFRLAEMMERCGDPIERVAEVCRQSGEAARVKAPNTWDIFVPILLSNVYNVEREGERSPERFNITREQVRRIKRDWRIVEQMVYGASGGMLRLNSRVIEVADEKSMPYGVNAGWLYGPLDGAVAVRGSYDGVMSFHPRGPSVTGGGDCGPNGAAMSDLGPDRGWEVLLHEWNHQFDWAMISSEIGEGYPITHDSDGCGHQPIPSMGYGHRAAMRYYVTPAMYRRLEIADPDNGAGHIRSWRLTRIEVTDAAENHPFVRYAETFESDKRPLATWPLVTSESPFVDIKKLARESDRIAEHGNIAQAVAFVRSDRRQEVRFWLGHDDGMAVWLNGNQIHQGRYYATAKFKDANLPDMIATFGVLRPGWNRIDCFVENVEPRDSGFGFSLRICDFDNRPVAGLHVATQADVVPGNLQADTLGPRPGRYYNWNEVRDDFHRKLPRLDAAYLRSFGNLPDDFEIAAKIKATQGFVALAAWSQTDLSDATVRNIPVNGIDEFEDRRVNNVLDWRRESIAVYPIERNRTRRHLLVIRPEAIDAFLTCLRESPRADETFEGRRPRNRVLGYLRVGEEPSIRTLIVVETLLPMPLPTDEEDLLAPLPG